MAESLLSSSNIWLFGCVVEDLEVSQGSGGDPDGNGFLNKALNGTPDAKFARIYCAEFEGMYVTLPAPMLFLVHGEGVDAKKSVKKEGGVHEEISFGDDVRAWSYEKSDFTIRLDVDTGPFENVLLDVVFGDDGFGGAGVSGANVRGANVRGANVRGANVRGANVRGANVRGANVRGAGGD